MPKNVFAPFGFRWVGMINASAPNYSPMAGKIAATDTTAIYRGDPIVIDSDGYVTKATTGARIDGIFQGCEFSTLTGVRQFRNDWPGLGALEDAIAFVVNTPEALFAVQSGNGGPVVQSNVGKDISFSVGTGNIVTGISGAYADFATIASNGSLPFHIMNYAGNTAGGPIAPAIVGPGTNAASPFNLIYVRFNVAAMAANQIL